MITLDAGVIIALFDADDAHHERAVELLRAHIDEPFQVSALNLAEALVGATRAGRSATMLARLESLEVSVRPIGGDAAERLAEIRAHTGGRMPDCCVLLAAEESGSRVATFDVKLASSAEKLELEVL
ncbi:type II toxin-antitoxin system VapC family toxin [Microbacterium indicum]|uniref:type II toxin-antitoxin system VapC family toxin n=1 Tax=Microbacterium indicum TaxID=358100 RepID=UPI00040B1B8C|nr:PIN domain-containing protein [Microbacterium indicum]